MSRFDLSHPLVAGAASFAAALVCINMTWLVTTMFGLMSGFVGPTGIYYLWAVEAVVWLALAPTLYARILRDARAENVGRPVRRRVTVMAPHRKGFA